MFLASEYYRGRMTVKTLRMFSNEKDAWEYVKQFLDKRVYEIFEGKEPRFCKE